MQQCGFEGIVRPRKGSLERENYEALLSERERQYALFEKEVQIQRAKAQTTTLIIVLSLSATIIILLVVLIILNWRKIAKEKEAARITKELSDKLLFVSCKTVPSLIKTIDDLHSKYASSEIEGYNDFMKVKTSISAQFSKDIEKVISASDEANEKYGSLTKYEAAVQILKDNGFPVKDIAIILNTNQPSIRTLLSKIERKQK